MQQILPRPARARHHGNSARFGPVPSIRRSRDETANTRSASAQPHDRPARRAARAAKGCFRVGPARARWRSGGDVAGPADAGHVGGTPPALSSLRGGHPLRRGLHPRRPGGGVVRLRARRAFRKADLRRLSRRVRGRLPGELVAREGGAQGEDVRVSPHPPRLSRRARAASRCAAESRARGTRANEWASAPARAPASPCPPRWAASGPAAPASRRDRARVGIHASASLRMGSPPPQDGWRVAVESGGG